MELTPQDVWTLASTALVLIMTPGLALFYGGLVRVRSVVNMMLFSVSAMGVVGMLWILFGYSMNYFAEGESGFAGSPFKDFGLINTDPASFIGVGFGAVFAMITTALISGAIADRVGLGSWVLFSGVWATLGYFPVAAWVWGGGWIQNLGTTLGTPDVIDLAGGTVIHINAGAAALALALIAGQRVGFAPGSHKPHSVPLVTIGAALLWFGWIGFNSGLATEAGEAGLIVVNTLGAPAAGIVGWILVDVLRGKKPGVIGAASGAVAGLVAITPAAANLSPVWALLLGLLAGIACAFAIEWKYRLGYDDSLDVVGLHLVAGVIGSLYLGFFAFDDGLFTGGNGGLLLVQTISVVSVAVYSFVLALGIALAVKRLTGLRVPQEVEEAGIDSVHGEEAYAYESAR
ncbi:ammonium transporter [Leucobacter luti]|uniref:Ammonium transporter n=1 Tax=Leucobacter luti TaxID=340320 RepID=A0A4R6S467_9MICO|nr:ammonium transporter [Leucobacter luti]MCW2287263.1 Amt family ammonium transporter [Leucobacter luti]QYM76665.1 ammonium transporter [Leucobacter luti]TCK41486.1 ammonium transporter [Leucobacter luti]TDP94460.1 ammonium transporter [Leucobacter luti]